MDGDLKPACRVGTKQHHRRTSNLNHLFGNSLWTASWDPEKKQFDVAEAFSFADHNASIPLELYFRDNNTRLYVTTAKPGHLHIFDISKDLISPTLIKTLPGGEDSITVIDLKKKQVLDNLETFKMNGYNPNCIVLLPEWNDPAGH